MAFNGILVGASLDQSIKQLPARHRIGVIAYSAYAKASDLGNGIVWYAIIGIGSALLTLTAAIAVFSQHTYLPYALPIYIAGVLSILHTLATTQAAPTMFSQRHHENDEAALTAIFNRFERWQTIRAILQLLTLLALLWALVVYAR
ncbi:MAG: hypothetical protein H0X30_27230 [Anaerolineae bacterium]|nr:hypothetical protein [Anaerolineae bacterium]